MIQGLLREHLTQRKNLCKVRVDFSKKTGGDILQFCPNVVPLSLIPDREVDFSSRTRLEDNIWFSFRGQHTVFSNFESS